jgi:hypothetical protein
MLQVATYVEEPSISNFNLTEFQSHTSIRTAISNLRAPKNNFSFESTVPPNNFQFLVILYRQITFYLEVLYHQITSTVVFCTFFWLFLKIFDHFQLFFTVFDYFWTVFLPFQLFLNDHFWPFPIVFDHIWKCLTIFNWSWWKCSTCRWPSATISTGKVCSSDPPTTNASAIIDTTKVYSL